MNPDEGSTDSDRQMLITDNKLAHRIQIEVQIMQYLAYGPLLVFIKHYIFYLGDVSHSLPECHTHNNNKRKYSREGGREGRGGERVSSSQGVTIYISHLSLNANFSHCLYFTPRCGCYR